MSLSALPHPDVVIAGAGIIGLSLALALRARGAQVVVIERDTALRQASFAAAGMLAANDPHNPKALFPLAQFSISLYPGFLKHIETLSRDAISLQTAATVQYVGDGNSIRLAEHSLDPRQLAEALVQAVRLSGIELREHTELASAEESPGSVHAMTTSGERIHAGHLVHATGAWTDAIRHRHPHISLRPRKGQMLRVEIPPDFSLEEVHRSQSVYVVPRTSGPQAGTALVGATVEDTGFDTTVHSDQLASLRELAVQLDPALSFIAKARQVEAWAGLRPFTPDSLPFLGQLGHSREILAAGHHRNGILLAPATAQVIADLIEDKTPSVDLAAFSCDRFSPSSENP